MPIKVNHIFSLSIILALLSHSIVLFSFIFVFPLKKPSHKPIIIFIGSILQRETLSQKKKIFFPKSQISEESTKIFKIKKKTKDKLLAHFASTKPSIKNVPPTEKIIIKSNFLKSDSHDSKKSLKAIQKEPLIDPTPFNPLKLNTND